MFDAVALNEQESDVVAIIEGFLHDFKSPLMNLKIAQSMNDDEAVTASINTIDSFVTNLRTIIQDEKSQIDVMSAISHALKSCRYILSTFNTKIKIEVLNKTGFRTVIVQTRGMSLERIFLNLFKNAAEILATAPDPKLTITVEQDNDNVVVEIKDNGRGIDPELLPRIFEKGVTTKQGRNHGRGLHIVKTMMDRCYGEISVTSELGKGTSFYLTLPIYNLSK